MSGNLHKVETVHNARADQPRRIHHMQDRKIFIFRVDEWMDILQEKLGRYTRILSVCGSVHRLYFISDMQWMESEPFSPLPQLIIML